MKLLTPTTVWGSALGMLVAIVIGIALIALYRTFSPPAVMGAATLMLLFMNGALLSTYLLCLKEALEEKGKDHGT